MEKWTIAMKKADFDEIGRKFHVSNILARIIRNRDLTEDAEIRKFLYGTAKDLYSPYLMKDMEKAVNVVKDKIDNMLKLRVIGDYDSDGINSTYILYKGLKICGAEVDYDIPDRITDGYGMNVRMIEEAHDAGIDTIITCDNGVSAAEAVNKAKEYGMTVIITDHHQVPMDGENMLVKSADAVVNPHRQDCTYPFKELCGAGIAYKLISALYDKCNIPEHQREDFIENVAIATVCDVVDLKDENRIIVKEGLERLKNTKNIGLNALMNAVELTNMNLNTYHIGFIIGPCINACGRLESAKTGMDLLLSEDERTARILAGSMRELNERRKDQTEQGLWQAKDIIENEKLYKDKVIVVYLNGCHESLVGIIAGRLKEEYLRPVYVFTDALETYGDDTRYLKGSGRSTEMYSMYDELVKLNEAAENVLVKFGGHPMAAGLTIKKSELNQFREKINKLSSLSEEDFFRKVELDMVLPFSYITMNLVDEIESLKPYGKGNPRPLMARKNVEIQNLRVLGKNRNALVMTLKDETGCVMQGMLFQDADEFQNKISERIGKEKASAVMEGKRTGAMMDIAFYPEINEYKGTRSLRITIQNYR